MVGYLEINGCSPVVIVEKTGKRVEIREGAEIELLNGWQWVSTRLRLTSGVWVADDGSLLYTGKWARYLGDR